MREDAIWPNNQIVIKFESNRAATERFFEEIKQAAAAY